MAKLSRVRWIFELSFLLLALNWIIAPGWDEGVLTMKIGEVARLTLTPDYGYVFVNLFASG